MEDIITKEGEINLQEIPIEIEIKEEKPLKEENHKDDKKNEEEIKQQNDR